MSFRKYRLVDDFNTGSNGQIKQIHYLTEEGFKVIYDAYSSRYGTSQSMERLMERGGFNISEIRFLKQKGVLRRDYNYTQYIVDTEYTD